MCNEVLWVRQGRGPREGGAGRRGCCLWGADPDTLEWLTKCCFSIVAVCRNGVRLCLLLWERPWLLEVWGSRQYRVQQCLLWGSHPALWWRWQDHPLWQWVCPVPITQDTGPLCQGTNLPTLPAFRSFIHLATLIKPLPQARYWPDPGDKTLSKTQALPSRKEGGCLKSNWLQFATCFKVTGPIVRYLNNLEKVTFPV